MSKSRSVLLFCALALLAASVPSAFGQNDGPNPFDTPPGEVSPKQGYLEFPGQNQTRNLPAGTVMDPGSHLTYILDTGINARKLTGQVSLADYGGQRILQTFADLLDQNGDGHLDQGAIFQNFISITNTNPTLAVTIHFRYYNDNCEDLLDFLVVLTCNDTLLFDPFNFVIPYTNGENSYFRFFRTQPGKVLSPISTREWGSGRFIVTAAASGTTRTQNSNADILFPAEWKGLHGECNIKDSGSWATISTPMEQILNRGTGIRNVGTVPGLLDGGLPNANNLHVFNASQISFNYLTGNQTVAVPGRFITDAAGEGARFLAYGLNPWIRPAIDGVQDQRLSRISGRRSGDGPQVPTGRILMGLELGWRSNTATRDVINTYYLRSDVHGGDAVHVVGPYATTSGGYSQYGALGTSAFHITTPENAVQHFISVSDDYNGSNNEGLPGIIPDRAANISPAYTRYILQIYDQAEHQLIFPPDTPINVSPPVFEGVVDLKMVCICLRTFLTSTIAPGTNVDDLTIADMANVFGPEVLNGRGNFNGLLDKAVGEDFRDPLAKSDLAGGWIRYVRDNTGTVGALNNVLGDPTYEVSASVAASVGLDISGGTHGSGTTLFDVSGVWADTLAWYPTFLTAAQQVVKFEGFGAAWWNFAVASDPRISEEGVACLNPTAVGCNDKNSW